MASRRRRGRLRRFTWAERAERRRARLWDERGPLLLDYLTSIANVYGVLKLLGTPGSLEAIRGAGARLSAVVREAQA